MRERTDDKVSCVDSGGVHYVVAAEEVSLLIIDLLAVICFRGVVA